MLTSCRCKRGTGLQNLLALSTHILHMHRCRSLSGFPCHLLTLIAAWHQTLQTLHACSGVLHFSNNSTAKLQAAVAPHPSGAAATGHRAGVAAFINPAGVAALINPASQAGTGRAQRGSELASLGSASTPGVCHAHVPD